MWPEDYYREMDGTKRKKLLDEALAASSGEDAAEDRLRLMIWQARYAPETQSKKKQTKQAGEIDYFVRAWLDLSLIASQESSFRSNRVMRSIREDAGALLLDRYSSEPSFSGLLDQEYAHLCQLLFRLYLSDGRFTHRIWGFGDLGAEELQSKVAARLFDVTQDLPERCGQTELFEPLKRAAEEAYRTSF